MLGIAPQDEFGLYDAPTVTTVATVANQTVKLIGADTTRAVLIISSASTSVSCYVAPTGQGGNSIGLSLQQGDTYIAMSWNDFGPLVCSGWDVFSTSVGLNVTAIAMSLRRDPALSGYDVFKRPRILSATPRPSPQFRHRPYPVPGRLPAALLARLGRLCPRMLGGEQ